MGNIQNVKPANAAGTKSVSEVDLNIQIIKPEIKAFMDDFQAELANTIKTEHPALCEAVKRSNNRSSLSKFTNEINGAVGKILNEKLKKDTPVNNFLKEIFFNISGNFKEFFIYLVTRPLDLKNIILSNAKPDNSRGASVFLMEVVRKRSCEALLKKYAAIFKEAPTAVKKAKRGVSIKTKFEPARAKFESAGFFKASKSVNPQTKEKIEEWMYEFLTELLKDKEFIKQFSENKISYAQAIEAIEVKLSGALQSQNGPAGQFLGKAVNVKFSASGQDDVFIIRRYMANRIVKLIAGKNRSITDLPAMAETITQDVCGVRIFEKTSLYGEYSKAAGISPKKGRTQLKSEVGNWLRGFMDRILSDPQLCCELDLAGGKEKYRSKLLSELMYELRNPRNDAERFLKRILEVKILDKDNCVKPVKDIIVSACADVGKDDYLKDAGKLAARFGCIDKYRGIDLYVESILHVYGGGKKKRVRRAEGKLDKMKRDLGIGSPDVDAQAGRAESSPEVEAAKKRLRARFKASRVKTRAPRARVEIPKLPEVKPLPKLPVK